MKTFVSKLARTIYFLIPLSVLMSGCLLNRQPESISFFAYSSNESNGREIYLSDYEGKSRVKITSFTRDDGYPAISPDGKRIAFYGKYNSRNTWSIHTANLDGTSMQRLTGVQNVWDSAPDWSPDSKTIVFAREYEDSEKEWQEEIWLMNADGSEQRQIEALEGRAPYFMQDGRILFHSKTGPSQICIADNDGNNLIQLTRNDANDWSPKASPDGMQIAFLSNRDGNQEIYTMSIDGSNQTRLTFNDVDDWGPSWSADGSRIFFNSKNGIYKMSKDGSSIEKILESGSQISNTVKINKSDLVILLQTK